MNATFSCYLGDGEFDYYTLPLGDGSLPTEIGDAIDHFLKKYPHRSWRMYVDGTEATEEPLYRHDPLAYPIVTPAGETLLEALFGA